jgi:hypothetical protein
MPINTEIQTLMERFRQEGRVEKTDPAVVKQATSNMNAQMEAVRQEYRQRERESQLQAARTVLTA